MANRVGADRGRPALELLGEFDQEPVCIDSTHTLEIAMMIRDAAHRWVWVIIVREPIEVFATRIVLAHNPENVVGFTAVSDDNERMIHALAQYRSDLG